MIDQDSVGKPFVDEHGEIWVCTSYSSSPTATFERLERLSQLSRGSTPCVLHGVVGSLRLSEMRELVPDQGVSSRP